MGAKDIKRQKANVLKMRLLGAEIIQVKSGSALKDAMNEALRDWVSNVENTFYIIGTADRASSLSYDGKRLSVNNW